MKLHSSLLHAAASDVANRRKAQLQIENWCDECNAAYLLAYYRLFPLCPDLDSHHKAAVMRNAAPMLAELGSEYSHL
ncbi:MAG: hypothetical protein NW215_10710 [Hyphomicrobiales bacterium]|nr:hypothetical protein [Hyphomicrobiales bacterium]